MKTFKKQCEEVIGAPFNGHPSREDEQRIRQLEGLVIMLAQQIDNLIYNQP